MGSVSLMKNRKGLPNMETESDWTILSIDDEADIREIIQLTLEDAGYQVHTAPDGETGLRLCAEIGPRIVITDIRMPGMDGLQVLETVKRRHPDMEVIVATAFGEMDLAIRALQLDASDFINKPINVEALHLALGRAKRRYTTRKELADYTALLEKAAAETGQELVKAVSFQKNLIESAMDGILGCDETGAIVIYNQSMEQILGYPKTEVLSKMTLEHFFASGDAERLNAALCEEERGGRGRLNLYETTMTDSKKRQVPVQVSATLLNDGDHAAGAVYFFRDLRKIRMLEREMADQARILHQDKMMSLGRLAASVVHEINNPLSGILNYLKLMGRILDRRPSADAETEKFRRYLDIVEKETGRCSRIISGLLTFSRKSPPAFAEVSVQDLMDRCVLLSQHKLDLGDISLTQEIEPDLPSVLGDINQLQQCIINLVFNAVDAMPEGGALFLGARYDAEEDLVILTVRDTGPGIPADEIPRIFEPFYTTKKEGHGVGLGLSTVFGIVERHKGTIRVESAVGKGATFSMKLPPMKARDRS